MSVFLKCQLGEGLIQITNLSIACQAFEQNLYSRAF